MKVRRVDEVFLSNGKAAYSQIGSGIIFVNKSVFKDLNKFERTFVMLHEAGHIELETTDEKKADLYAFSEYVKLGYPAEHIITAMDKVLTNKPQNIERKSNMKQVIEKMKFQCVDGAPATGWGDWFSWAASAMGLASEIAGGSASQRAADEAEAKALEEEKSNKKIISYVLAGLAIIAIVVLINVKKIGGLK